jgi:hypothetical protein
VATAVLVIAFGFFRARKTHQVIPFDHMGLEFRSNSGPTHNRGYSGFSGLSISKGDFVVLVSNDLRNIHWYLEQLHKHIIVHSYHGISDYFS